MRIQYFFRYQNCSLLVLIASYSSMSKRCLICYLAVLEKPYFREGRLEDEHRDEGAEFSWICLANGDPPVGVLFIIITPLFCLVLVSIPSCR